MNNSLDILITPEARQWLGKHGGAVTLRMSPRHGCCGGTAEVPVAEARRPDCPEKYKLVETDGVCVHVARDLDTDGPVELRLEKLMGFGRLFVEVRSPAARASGLESECDDV